MESNVLGIHHITVIRDDPQHNIDFYAGVLGLRLVKNAVNFDVPDTYHMYKQAFRVMSRRNNNVDRKA